MEKLTFEEIKTLLVELTVILDNVSDGEIQFVDGSVYITKNNQILLNLLTRRNVQESEQIQINELLSKLGNFELKEQFGGEGDGDRYYSVYHFQDHDIYVKLSSFYSSYDGVDYDDISYYNVEPVEVTKIEYLIKK